MSCPTQSITGCDFGQFMVQQTPVFDEMIMEDITPTDGWLGNVSTHNIENGTPTEITQDRFRTVVPNTARPWSKTSTGNCLSNPCDPSENQLGWGSDRLTYFEEQQTWTTPLLCFEQLMTVTAAQEQISNIITKTLKPATSYISSAFLRKRTLFWSKYKFQVNPTLDSFTYQWNLDAGGNEAYFDTSVSPSNVYKMVPQALQNMFSPLMLIGYSGMNPFKDTAPFMELVADMETCWELDKLGGQQGDGG